MKSSKHQTFSNGLTSSPSTKYMGTVNNKQIKMDEKNLKLTAKSEKSGKMYTQMNVDSGIVVKSDKKIEIQSQSSITFIANKISVESEK